MNSSAENIRIYISLYMSSNFFVGYVSSCESVGHSISVFKILRAFPHCLAKILHLLTLSLIGYEGLIPHTLGNTCYY